MRLYLSQIVFTYYNEISCDTVHLLFHACSRKFTISIIIYRNMTVCISVFFQTRRCKCGKTEL